MIDFRYHLVSLISVFLALAVGIVLGAGPLRENLGDQLAGQVEQLRTEQDQLRTQSEELATRNDQLATFISEIGPELVEGTLDGKQVAVITDDSSTRPAIERMAALLTDAGVEAPVRIDLQPALWAPDAGQERTQAIEEIRAIAPAVLTADPESELTASAQLTGIIPTLLHGDEEISPELRTQLWQVLVDHQLIALEGDVPDHIDAVVYTGAAPAELAVEEEDEAVATERAQTLLAAQTHLLSTLAGTGMPAVVSAATPGNDASNSILRTVRGDRAFDSLSTTDRLGEPDGPLLAVLALVEQTRGGSGAYGTTNDAEDRLPSLPETEVIPDEMTEGTTGQGADGQGADGQGAPPASDGGGEG